MSIKNRSDTGKISSLVQQHIPKAKLTRRQEAELNFTLPFESLAAFAGTCHLIIFVRSNEWNCHQPLPGSSLNVFFVSRVVMSRESTRWQQSTTFLLDKLQPGTRFVIEHTTFTLAVWAGLFSELDSRPDLGLVNYGVSMTTLEDVFLRLEAEAEVDEAGESGAKPPTSAWA